MLQWLRLGSRVRVGFRVGVTDSNTHHTHTHTHTQLVSYPSDNSECEQIAIHVPASADTQLGQMILILTLTITLAQKIRKKPDSRLTILAKSIVSGGKNVTPVIWSHIKTTSLA